MKRILRRLPVLAMLAAVLWLAGGCDEPNDPDLPPYRVVATYSAPAAINDIAVSGDYVALAASSYGMLLLDAGDLANLDTIYSRTVPSPQNCQVVGLDPIHHYVAYGTQGRTVAAYDFLADTFAVSFVFQAPLNELIIEPSEDVIKLWGADPTATDGFVGFRLCRNPDSTAWTTTCDFFWENWIAPAPYQCQGMALKENVAALCIEGGGVHFHDVIELLALGDVRTYGDAYDCEWHGNYLMVADQFCMSVVNATDPLHPALATSFFIPGADRLRRIALDGDMAYLMDINDGVYIVDISNPLSPKLVQSIAFSEPTDIAAQNGCLYVSDAIQGLLIYKR